MQKTWTTRILLLLAAACVFVYAALTLLLAHFEGPLIFPAPRTYASMTPQVLGLRYEDLRIPIDGATSLRAWFVPSAKPSDRAVIVFHGNAQVLDTEVQHEVRLFHALDANFLFVEYRGYGASSPASVSGTTIVDDARATLRYLEQQRHVPRAHIVLCGRSIGTTAATSLAAESPGIAGLILISPLTSVPDVAKGIAIYRPFLAPVSWLHPENILANRDRIGSVHAPLLLVEGTEDDLAPPWMTRELFARANAPKTIGWINGAGHNDLTSEPYAPRLVSALRTFLDSIPK